MLGFNIKLLKLHNIKHVHGAWADGFRVTSAQLKDGGKLALDHVLNGFFASECKQYSGMRSL